MALCHPIHNRKTDLLDNKTADQAAYLFIISGFDDSVHSDYVLVDSDAVWSTTFWIYTLSPP
jgi:hypothetical protein